MGSDPLPLVMLPGLDGTGMVFEPLLDQLGATIAPRIVSYPTNEILGLFDYVELARNALPTESPFVLLAESFSGPIGLQLLTAPPDNLVGVIFVTTFARYPRPFLLDLARNLPQDALRGLFETRLGCRFFCLGAAPKSAVALFQQAISQVKTATLTSRLNLLAHLPPPPTAGFRGSCLYLQASQDHLVPSRATVEMQKVLPQMDISTLKGPHTILLAQPENGARLIQQFVHSLQETP